MGEPEDPFQQVNKDGTTLSDAFKDPHTQKKELRVKVIASETLFHNPAHQIALNVL